MSSVTADDGDLSSAVKEPDPVDGPQPPAPVGGGVTHRGMEDLPEELIEIILSYLLPYRDSANAAAVCKLWRRIVTALNIKKKQLFRQAIENGTVSWQCRRASVYNEPSVTGRRSNGGTPTPWPTGGRGVSTMPCRLGQSAVCVSDSIIAFGGLSDSCTSFNDLWRLDLNTMTWRKVVTTGIPPPPRGNMTMIRYRDDLIIHGGRPGFYLPGSTRTGIYSIPGYHDTIRYSLTDNRWSVVDNSDLDAGVRSRLERSHHSACLLGDRMVLFGGLPSNNNNNNIAYNDVWSLNLEKFTWEEMVTTERKPSNRFGQIQVNLDDAHIMLLGGVESVMPGQFEPRKDVWILKTDCRPWKWILLEVTGDAGNEPSELHNKDACIVGNRLILFDESKDSSLVSSKIPPAPNKPPGGRLLNSRGYRSRTSGGHFNPLGGPAIQMHVLDISEVKCNHTVRWLSPIRPSKNGTVPPAIKVFSTVEARGEFVLFGGYYCQPSSVPLPLNEIVYIVSAKSTNNVR